VTLTLSGRIVRREGNLAPTLRDIGVALGRIPRFAGHARYHWTVLHHSLAMGTMAEALDLRSGRPEMARVLGALLHDAHEAVTNDIPTPWKNSDNRIDQYLLDKMIFKEHLNMLPPALWPVERREEIHEWDRQLLAAEALLVGPPVNTLHCFPQPAPCSLRALARTAVEMTRGRFPNFKDTQSEDATYPRLPPAVEGFVDTIFIGYRQLDFKGRDAYAWADDDG
jgi:hypothetical protein